jgi:hypothetical protein
MEWEKLGNLFEIKPVLPYLNSHATNPVALHLYDDIFRIFFSSRDEYNKSSVSYVDLDIFTHQIHSKEIRPSFIYSPESFFSHGISIGNIYEVDAEKFILFMGWHQRPGQHWYGQIGRLLIINDAILELSPKKVFMTLDKEDPISLSYPFVKFHEGIFKMWYGSTISWSSENGEMVHVIKYATSVDGINWRKKGVAIPFEIGKMQAFSKPSVMIDINGYHMWYSFRSGNGTPYRIGYSFSSDGITWVNKLESVGIDVSTSGWDSEMICYPYVFDHKNERYMLYNGNGYGKTGFGLAKLKGN